MMVGMGQPNSAPSPSPWTFESRGPFTFGHCQVCGFRTPARRARYSAEEDLRTHAMLCEATESLSAVTMYEALEPTE
jgi:hypothetical protein